MDKVVLDVSMSLDGFTAGPTVEGRPVAGSVTHLRFRVRDYGPGK
jgi:hypothetical protein